MLCNLVSVDLYLCIGGENTIGWSGQMLHKKICSSSGWIVSVQYSREFTAVAAVYIEWWEVP